MNIEFPEARKAMIFRGDRNCLHDDLAKTRVIKLSATSNQ
ncbi:MAG: hypothetical protein ACJAT6_001638 [Akkermansiaceae bacterium]|jgi:hypothetical protein